MTVSEAASFLGVSTQYIHAIKKKAGFPTMEKLWNEYVLPRHEMQAWAEKHKPRRKKHAAE